MDKSEKARISVQKRWDKNNKENTNVLRTKNDSNTIKERKGKERKEKDTVSEFQKYIDNPENESITFYLIKSFLSL
jgi:hypothetical protein